MPPLQRAVSLQWLLNDFLFEHPQIQRDRMTTRAVVEDIIKPATSRAGTSYAQWLAQVRAVRAVGAVRGGSGQ
eukprot:141578-Chlamydomonas_euryale.AAC.1